MADSSAGYPLAAFHFKVTVGGFKQDTGFQEVTGISSKIQTEAMQEGGDNSYVYQMPTKVEYSNLILKRGMVRSDSELVEWCKSIFESELNQPIAPKDIQVSLLDENHDPIRSWSFFNAYPVSWEMEGFNSTKNEVAIETIEFCYRNMKREK